jgi:D-alanine-D-alanine ligase
MQTIGVFFGSRSPEHDISILTAMLVISNLRSVGYNVVPIYITREGEWLTRRDFDIISTFENKDNLNSGSCTTLLLDLNKSNGAMAFKENKTFGKEIVVDIAFPCFHGLNGEDGSIQGWFQMLQVPFVGCDVVSSAVAMNKVLTKRMMVSSGIPTPKFVEFSKFNYENYREQAISEIRESLKLPVFVKPPHLGSSIGISKVDSWDDLESKIDLALYYDNQVIIEEGVADMMDVTCCVIGNDDTIASQLQASNYSKDFFSYEDKYLNNGGAQTGEDKQSIIIPAPVSDKLTNYITETAKEVFRVLGCSGIARVDFLINQTTGQFYVNEVNTLPGTIYSHLWKESGIPTRELVVKLIGYALDKHQANQEINTIFVSNVINSISSQKLGNKLSGGME